MDPESSLPYSQVPATCPYPEPAPSSPPTPSNSWRSILILSSHLSLGLPNGLLPSDFPTKTVYRLIILQCDCKDELSVHEIINVKIYS
jgi:hypothetical protein